MTVPPQKRAARPKPPGRGPFEKTTDVRREQFPPDVRIPKEAPQRYSSRSSTSNCWRIDSS